MLWRIPESISLERVSIPHSFWRRRIRHDVIFETNLWNHMIYEDNIKSFLRFRIIHMRIIWKHHFIPIRRSGTFLEKGFDLYAGYTSKSWFLSQSFLLDLYAGSTYTPENTVYMKIFIQNSIEIFIF